MSEKSYLVTASGDVMRYDVPEDDGIVVQEFGEFRLSDEELKDFVRRVARDDPGLSGRSVYLKALRSAMHALGFDPDWVEGPFREALEEISFV